MFRRIREKFQCLEGKDKNSNVWQDKIRIPMIERTGKNSMFARRTVQFECLEG